MRSVAATGYRESMRYLAIGLGLVAAVSIAGCKKRDLMVLDPSAAMVAIVNAAPDDCKVLGDVEGRSRSDYERAEAVEGARNDLRNQTAYLGGTHVELQQTVNQGNEVVLIGQAYCCPSGRNRC